MKLSDKRTQLFRQFDRLNARTTLVVIFVAGLTFRLFLLRYRYAVGFDEVNYLKLAAGADLHGLSSLLHTYWSPFYPFMVSVLSGLFGDFEITGRAVSLVAGSLLVLPSFWLGRLLYGEKTGLICALFVALYPPLAFLSTAAQTEALYMLLVASSVLAVWSMLKYYSVGMAFITGILTGLLYLTRPEGIGLLLISAVWVLAAVVFRVFLITRLRAGFILVFLFGGFLVVSAPYLLYLKRATGAWTVSAKGTANLQMDTPVGEPKPHFHGLDASNRTVPVDEIYHLGTFANAVEGRNGRAVDVRLKDVVAKYARNVYDVIKRGVPAFLTTLPMLLLGAGLVGRKWRVGEGKKNILLLSVIGFYWFGVVPAFHINERYFTALWPLVAVWISEGSLCLYRWIKEYPLSFKLNRRPKPKDARVAAAVVVALWVAFAFLPEFGKIIVRSPDSTDYWADAVEQRAAGLWLKERGARSPVIMARNHAVSFYAGNYDIRESVTLPRNEISRVLEYARFRNVKYIVLNERYKEDYPELAFLLNAQDVPAGLKPIYQSDFPKGLRTVIYEVLP